MKYFEIKSFIMGIVFILILIFILGNDVYKNLTGKYKLTCQRVYRDRDWCYILNTQTGITKLHDVYFDNSPRPDSTVKIQMGYKPDF